MRTHSITTAESDLYVSPSIQKLPNRAVLAWRRLHLHQWKNFGLLPPFLRMAEPAQAAGRCWIRAPNYVTRLVIASCSALDRALSQIVPMPFGRQTAEWLLQSLLLSQADFLSSSRSFRRCRIASRIKNTVAIMTRPPVQHCCETVQRRIPLRALGIATA